MLAFNKNTSEDCCLQERLILADSWYRIHYIMARIAIFGVWFVLVVSFSSLLFFVFLVNPKYLSFTGFLVFYAAVFGFLWGAFLLLWNYLKKKRGRRGGLGDVSRQAVFLAMCAVIVLFFSQMNVLSLYVLAPFGALVAFTQYILIKRG